MAAMTGTQRWSLVVAYAVAMAYVEAAVVFYLRAMAGKLDPVQVSPGDLSPDIVAAEMVREAATLIMLLAVGWLAGRTWRGRLGYFLVVFGLWDIFYYIFLVPLTGWPRSLFDWDILFLLPLPWWGPVWSPVSIALLMVIGGTLFARVDEGEAGRWPARWAWSLNGLGLLLALYVFMADAIQALTQGRPPEQVIPSRFNWPLFLASWLLMAAPIFDLRRPPRQSQEP